MSASTISEEGILSLDRECGKKVSIANVGEEKVGDQVTSKREIGCAFLGPEGGKIEGKPQY